MSPLNTVDRPPAAPTGADEVACVCVPFDHIKLPFHVLGVELGRVDPDAKPMKDILLKIRGI